MQNVAISSFYHFIEIQNVEDIRDGLLDFCVNSNLLGTILVSNEGFNGTIAGEKLDILGAFSFLEDRLKLNLSISNKARWNATKTPPFRRMRVKIKKEIVALGREDLRPFNKAGKSIEPKDWNKLIKNPEVILIDTRNKYEIDIGSFPNAINPGTDSFREFPSFVDELNEIDKKQPIAMFCTGGIRCEKAAAYMLEMGYEDVSQLNGGILNYLENIETEDNHWEGECFVFDDRVAVDCELKDGNYIQCHACRNPLSAQEIESETYIEGVSCPKCINKISDEKIEGLRERQKQIDLAKKRGEDHIGKILK